MAIDKSKADDVDKRDHDIAKTEAEHSDEPRQPVTPEGMNQVHEGKPDAELAHPQPDDGMDSILAQNVNPDDVVDPESGNFVLREGHDAGQHDTRNDRSPSRPNTDDKEKDKK
jgi:hypothetical protein